MPIDPIAEQEAGRDPGGIGEPISEFDRPAGNPSLMEFIHTGKGQHEDTQKPGALLGPSRKPAWTPAPRDQIAENGVLGEVEEFIDTDSAQIRKA